MMDRLANRSVQPRKYTYVVLRAEEGLGAVLWEHRTLARRLCALLSFLAVFLALWLTLRHSGDLPSFSFMPGNLEQWINGHGRDRNLPAYFLFGLPLFCLVPTRGMRLGFAAAATFAALLEFVQLLVPTRTFDWMDIVLSWIGLVFAYLLVRNVKHRVLFRRVIVPRTHGISRTKTVHAGRN